MTENRRAKVCVTRMAEGTSSARELLTKAGCELILGPARFLIDPPYSREELLSLIGGCDAVLTTAREGFSRDIITACPNLQAIATCIIGTDAIDLEAATELGILVCNSPADELFVGVAEAAVGFIVALSKKFKTNEAYLRDGNWYRIANRGVILAGQTLGFVGFGRIAREMATRLKNWGLRLIAYDPYVNPEAARSLSVEMVPFETVLRESDIVSVNVMLTPETRHMITMEQLRMMKPTAYIINTARGAVFKQEDLAEALNENVIAGAALDAFEKEPLPKDDPLRNVDPTRLIMTPHIVGHCATTEAAGYGLAAESLATILQDRIPATLVNPEAIPRWRERFGD